MTSHRPKISIIVPVYNVEKYLHRCINSILAQTFTDFEIILINDGSTDSSGKICDEYAQQYENIIVFHSENKGASLARKIGLQKANGEYVAFVDSDDFVSVDYIESLYNLIVKYNTHISACGVCLIKDENDITQLPASTKDCVLDFDTLMRRFFKYEFWGFWGKIYHKSLFDNIIFPLETVSEDYYVMAQIFMNEKKMAITNNQMYYYEKHEGSLSSLKLSSRSFDEFPNVVNTYNLIKQHYPQYSSLALSNVVETCVKLLGLSKCAKIEFRVKRNDMISFLKQNLNNIMIAQNIFWKYKVLTLKILLLQWLS